MIGDSKPNLYNLVSLQSLDPPQYVFWYHNGKIINYERVSRVSVQTDPGKKHMQNNISAVCFDEYSTQTFSMVSFQ